MEKMEKNIKKQHGGQDVQQGIDFIEKEKKEYYRTGKTYEELFGIKKAKELKENMRNMQLGISDDHRLGIEKSKIKKDKIKKYLTGKTYEEKLGLEKAKITKEKLSKINSGENNPMFGTIAYNKGKKGLYKTSEEVKAVLREYRKNQKNVPENNPLIGKKISAKLKGKTYEQLYGPEKAKELKEKRAQFIKNQYKSGTPNLGFPKDGTMKEARKKQVFPLKDTKIEVKLQNYLKQLGIEFITHQYIDIKYGYQADILIPVQHGISQKIVIEADGDYWHCNPKKYDFRKMPLYIKEQVPLDFERTVQLEEAGFKVLRLWESDINNMLLEDFKQRLFNIKSNLPILFTVNKQMENV